MTPAKRRGAAALVASPDFGTPGNQDDAEPLVSGEAVADEPPVARASNTCSGMVVCGKSTADRGRSEGGAPDMPHHGTLTREKPHPYLGA